MDPVSAFGLISGGIQVLQAIGSTVHGLNQLYGRFKDADLTIQSLIQELNCIGTALASLKEWIRLNSSMAPQPEEYNNDLAVALEGCRVVMDVVSHDVSDLVQSTQEDQLAVTGLRVRMRVVWNEETMKGHQEKLRAQVIALQLLLQVCQCRTSTEQVRLLRKATTRRVFDRVADDTATVLSSRGSSYAGSVSQGSRRSFSFSDRETDFNNTLANSPVYLRVGQPVRTPTTGSLETQPTIQTGNRSPFTDEGYASNRTQTSLTVPSLDIPVQQEGLLALPSSPSGPVHNRSVSHTHVPTQSTMNATGIRRNASDSKASSPAMRTSGSKLERIASSFIGRINTRSRANLAASPGGSSTLSASPGSGRRKHRLDGDLNTSIDLNSDDTTALPQIIKAAQSGSRDEVERLIERGSDIEARHQRSGRNALLVAAHCGRDDVIDLLIQHNARLAVVDRLGDTALHLAASRGHCGVLKLLLPECDLIEVQNSKGRTPLRVAADYGQSETLEVLLANHAQVNGRAENQMTALHAAAKRGDEEVVQLLVSHSADLEAKDGLMMTALHYACGGGHLEVIKLLLDYRANIEAPGDARKTPLICAAESGRSKAVELLLKRKASTRATDEMGMAAIHWAAYNGHHEALRLLSEKKGSLDLVNNMGRTALHLAAMQSQFAVVELLQRKGMPLDRRCKMGLTALHYACMADSLDITSLLLLTGADIEAAETEHQQRPLHIVAVRGSVDLLDFLCDKGASLAARNGVGDRALCVASRYGHVAAVQRLLDRESPLCLKFDIGFREDSPLCLAAMGGHWPVISLLLARGASVLKKDETGWSALRYAAYHGHADVLQLLLSNSSLPETDVPEVIAMPETIGFSRGVPEENKHRVQGVLAQALGNRYPNPLPNHNRFSWAPQAACSVPFGSLPGTGVPSLPVHFPFEADSSTPQELPGSLDQDLSSSRSISPDRTPNNSTGSTSARQLGEPNSRQRNEANPPVTNVRVTASLEESRRASQPREQPLRPRNQPQSSQTSATYGPIPSLRGRPAPTPSPPLQSPSPIPYRTRNDHSTASSIISSSGQSIESARIPRTLPAQTLSTPRDVSCLTSHSEDQAQDSGSDTDSISSVYTAPEGCEPDEVPTFTRRAEIEEAAR